MDTDLARSVSSVTERLFAFLGDRIMGIYLHGSAAMDAFVPSRSDVDVLVVTHAPISPGAKRGIAGDLSKTSLPCPGVGLELSIVTEQALRTTSGAPPFELHLDTQEDRVVDGAGRNGDADLVAHFAMTRARGMALLGPPPAEVFPPVDRTRLIRTFVDDLTWGIDNGRGGYAVLNSCRALRYAREGVLGSKPEGGEWALAAGVGNPMVIRRALRRQRGEDVEVELAEASAFAEHVRHELLRGVL
jgi:hypothetical protein